MTSVEQGHLGGYIAGGDEATFYPELWDWLVKDLGVRTVLDIGCGDGQAIDYFQNLGCKCVGIEGIPQNSPHIITHDFTKGPFDFIYEGDYDLVWSCEFVEHVEEEFVPNFLESFKRGKMVLMTHAVPGQGGYHHVNCQPAKYWIDKMREIGFTLDVDLTFLTREHAAKNISPWNHYVRSGMAFRRDHG